MICWLQEQTMIHSLLSRYVYVDDLMVVMMSYSHHPKFLHPL